MASTSEQGHNRNAVNFDTLITNCLSYGTTYNPSKAALKTAALQAQSTAAKTQIAAVIALSPGNKNAISARKGAFRSFDNLITRVSNSAKASDITQEVKDTILTLVRKLKGRRATPKKTDAEKTAAEAAGKKIIEKSDSQMSYDNRIENFEKLIKLLASIPQYIPNEADLKVAALTALQADLKAKNLAVINTGVPLNNARILRNDIMYKANVGMVDIADDVKTYIKSLHGATSKQYKIVSGLRFVNYKD